MLYIDTTISIVNLAVNIRSSQNVAYSCSDLCFYIYNCYFCYLKQMIGNAERHSWLNEPYLISQHPPVATNYHEKSIKNIKIISIRQQSEKVGVFGWDAYGIRNAPLRGARPHIVLKFSAGNTIQGSRFEKNT